ncbi:MAG: hypothetical protein R3E01_14005 [Pirellulaceae bacterium]
MEVMLIRTTMLVLLLFSVANHASGQFVPGPRISDSIVQHRSQTAQEPEPTITGDGRSLTGPGLFDETITVAGATSMQYSLPDNSGAEFTLTATGELADTELGANLADSSFLISFLLRDTSVVDISGTSMLEEMGGSSLASGLLTLSSSTTLFQHDVQMDEGPFEYSATLEPGQYNLEVAVFASGSFTQTSMVQIAGVLTATGTGLMGDYNGNGTVDAADYTVWKDTFGSTTELAADGNGNQQVDAADYTVWKDHFGEMSPQFALVPEPGCGQALLLSLLALVESRLRLVQRRSSLFR